MRHTIRSGCTALVLLAVVAPGRSQTDAVSRDLTVLNNPQVYNALTDAVSREWTTLNDPRTYSAETDAVSREWTLLNDPRSFFALGDVVSREWTVVNDARAYYSLTDAVSREVTLRAGAIPNQDALDALRYAGGLVSLPADRKAALDVVVNGKVDMADAVRLARKAAGLDP